jgi:hypothetical protein
MVSLVDIVPQTRKVTIAAGDLELRGLGLRQIADLLVRFPALRQLIVNGIGSVDAEALIITMPEAVGAIIAEAAGQPEAAGKIADVLSVDDLMECLLAVRELTIGPVPLEGRLLELFGASVRGSRSNGVDSTSLDTSAPPAPSN